MASSTEKTTNPKTPRLTCAPVEGDRYVQGQIAELIVSYSQSKGKDIDLNPKCIKLDNRSQTHLIEINKDPNTKNILVYLRTSGMDVGLFEGYVEVLKDKENNECGDYEGRVDFSLIIDPKMMDTTNVQVGLQRTSDPLSNHLVLWSMIDHTTQAMSFNGAKSDARFFRVDEPSLLRMREEVPPHIVDKIRAEADKKDGYTEEEFNCLLNAVFRDESVQDKNWYREKLRAGLATHVSGYQQYIDNVLCNSTGELFRGVDAYEKLMEETRRFLLMQVTSPHEIDVIKRKMQAALEKKYSKVDAGFVERSMAEYFIQNNGSYLLPYLNTVNGQFGTNGRSGSEANGQECYNPIPTRLSEPLFIELIWNYWHEENMLNQALQVISLRFQNRTIPGKGKVFDNFAVDPLRRINNLLWGYIQKESSRLSVSRRSNEYDHQYGIRLFGKAVGESHAAESRSKFLEAFHNLLHQATRYYKEFDDTTKYADPFPLRNALREVHLVLSEGAHNQYGDLPWTARVEMLAQQYILARPEMREFLGGRIMVPYAEPWMDRLDAIKKVMGWGNANSTHFHDLARRGERLLLSIRFDQWNNDTIQSSDAANWAEYWRSDIQEYIHAYRSVTGVDLSTTDGNHKINTTMPGQLLMQRMAGKLKEARPQVSVSSNGQNGKVSQEVFVQHYAG